MEKFMSLNFYLVFFFRVKEETGKHNFLFQS